MLPRRSAVVAVVLTAALAAGCSGGHKGASSTPTTARPTPLARLHLATVQVARAQFCDRVAQDEVRRALGAKPDAHQTWGNGDPVPTAAPTVAPTAPGTAPATDSGDVGHELGCAWTTSSGAAARAWVFARPVTADLANGMVAQAARQPGCTSSAETVFGHPALLQTCAPAGGSERVRRAGLFGDSWITCELSGPPATHPRARLDAWCAAVVAALDVS